MAVDLHEPARQHAARPDPTDGIDVVGHERNGVDPGGGEPPGPPPNTGDDQTGGPPKEATRTALIVALTTLIGALTAVATVNGEVGRMFRNDPGWTTAALGLILFATGCGLLSRLVPTGWMEKALLAVGCVGLLSGMGIALASEVQVLRLSDRPTIVMAVDPSSTGITLDAMVTGRKARAHDQIVVIAYGKTAPDHHLHVVYYAKVGPDTEGDLSQHVHITFDPRQYEGAYLSAVEVPEHVAPPNVDCDGLIVSDTGDTTITTDVDAKTGQTSRAPMSFRPNGEDPLVSCATVEFAGQP